MKKNRNGLKKSLLATLASGLLLGASAVYADDNHNKSYTLQGTCAFLPAGRATEFHGNPDRSKLNLGMAGNQWVVFDETMRQFTLWTGKGDGTEPAYRENNAAGFTLADLNDNANRYFIELIPPGQIRKQIKSGCLTLGNDEDRNFLPGNFQVKFDVYASTNYKLMQDLANNGFIDEAVPYIANRLDLMVGKGNPKGIGSTSHTGNADFDAQFDIIMDLLSGNVTAAYLDHINEGIHNAANGYMKKAHAYVVANDRLVTLADGYEYADGTTELAGTEMLASDWIQAALGKVATPMTGSPGALRLVSRDAGENHTSHALVDNACGTVTTTLGGVAITTGPLTFCEYALLNKANTHESRVHHVETPNGIQKIGDYVHVDVGYVWITELAYQLNHGNTAVQGMVGLQDIANLGIPNVAGVNADKIYSLAHLATSENEKKARQIVNFIRSPEGQITYVDGGFTGLTDTQLLGGRCYAKPVDGQSKWTLRTGPGSCDDWLGNGSF